MKAMVYRGPGQRSWEDVSEPTLQAEYVRVPFADNSTYRVPEGVSDEQMIMLADILPTSYEVGVLNGRVASGDVVVIIGAGPIGLAAVLTARLYSPSHIVAVDVADVRLDAARKLGADITVNSTSQSVDDVVAELTGGLGADVTMEAVGIPQTFEDCVRSVRPGGHVANIGVHGAPATLHLEDIWIKNLTITTGLVDTYSTPTLVNLVVSDRIDAASMITHRFPSTSSKRPTTFSVAPRTPARSRYCSPRRSSRHQLTRSATTEHRTVKETTWWIAGAHQTVPARSSWASMAATSRSVRPDGPVR